MGAPSFRRVALPGAVLCVLPAMVAAQHVAPPPRSAPDRGECITIAQGRAQGTPASVRVLAITRSMGTAATDSLVAVLTALGGRVAVRFDDIGYARAVLPADSVTRLRAYPIVAAYSDGTTALHDWNGGHTISRGGAVLTSHSSPRPDTVGAPLLTPQLLASNPAYVPLDEVRADVFARTMPLADGRGVTVAIVEAPLDFTHPALQEARSLAGEVIPKIAGIIDAGWLPGDGIREDNDRRSALVVRDTAVTSADGTVSIVGVVLHLPTPGTWHVGRWMRRTGYAAGDTVGFDVAWRDTMEVWIDVNHDRDFRNDSAVANLNVRFSAGTFPADSVHHLRPQSYAVAFDFHGIPCIYESLNTDHTVMVGGTIAGSHFLGTAIGGVAPGARLIPVVEHPGAGIANFLEGFILAARDPRVDMITHQGGLNRYPYVGGSVEGMVLDRLARLYHKSMFMSAGNEGPILGSLLAVGSTQGVFTMGAYTSRRSRETIQRWNLSDADDHPTLYSGRGPASDGALKPDLVAPTQMVTLAPCGSRSEDYVASHAGMHLPRCYQIGGGTSNSAPFAAGTAALLLSAARLRHLPDSATFGQSLGWALTASARRLTQAGIHEQGAGLIQVDSAWTLLQHLDRYPVYTIDISAPVENAYAPYLLTPGRGPGLYLREGWTAGRRGTRAITLTRTTGPAAPVTYQLRWRGNDGTFTRAPSTVTLQRDVSAQVAVAIAPRTVGIHSAALELVDPASDATITRVLTTVVAGLALTPAAHFTATQEELLRGPTDNRSTFVNVPPGLAAVRVTFHVRMPVTLQARVRDPLGSAFSTVQMAFAPNTDSVLSLVHPDSGTWEFTVSRATTATSPEDLRAPDRVPYTVTVIGLRAGAPATPAAPTFTNGGGVVTDASLVAAIGARRVVTGATRTLSDPIEVPVDSGTTSLRITLAVGAGGERRNAYLFFCGSGNTASPCNLQMPLTTAIGDGAVTLFNPHPGKWRLVVDAVGTHANPAPYTVTIVATHPQFGALELAPTDTAARRLGVGERWGIQPPRAARTWCRGHAGSRRRSRPGRADLGSRGEKWRVGAGADHAGARPGFALRPARSVLCPQSPQSELLDGGSSRMTAKQCRPVWGSLPL